MRVLNINHVKRTKSTPVDFSSLSPALRNLRLLLVLVGTNLSPLQMLMNVKKKLTDVTWKLHVQTTKDHTNANVKLGFQAMDTNVKVNLGLGQKANFSWDLVSYVHETLNVWLSYIKFVWMSLDHPTRSIRPLQTDRTSEDHLRNKLRSTHAMNKTNK